MARGDLSGSQASSFQEKICIGMQKDILALRGLEGESLWPPMAPYVDIEKMTELKHRNPEIG